MERSGSDRHLPPRTIAGPGAGRPGSRLLLLVGAGVVALGAAGCTGGSGGKVAAGSSASTTAGGSSAPTSTAGGSSPGSASGTGGTPGSTSTSAGAPSTMAAGGSQGSTGTTARASTAGTSTTVKPTTTTALAQTTTTAGSRPTTTTAAPTTTAGSTSVTATETEYKIELSASSFHPGQYVFHVENKGTTTHNLVVNGPGVSNKASSFLSPGESTNLDVTLQSGTYELYCGVGGHKELGMDIHITVS